jgi:hypothetical protein
MPLVPCSMTGHSSHTMAHYRAVMHTVAATNDTLTRLGRCHTSPSKNENPAIHWVLPVSCFVAAARLTVASTPHSPPLCLVNTGLWQTHVQLATRPALEYRALKPCITASLTHSPNGRTLSTTLQKFCAFCSKNIPSPSNSKCVGHALDVQAWCKLNLQHSFKQEH